jgi:hypothetical protein
VRDVIVRGVDGRTNSHNKTINWFKKVQNINYCSNAAQPTFNCHKRGWGRIMAQLFILSYSDAVSFRDIRGHLGTIPSIVTFYICVCRQKEERTSVPRPLSWNIYVKKQCRHINRAGYIKKCELID